VTDALEAGRRMAKVVARYRDGRVVKGLSLDFTPFREHFHVAAAGGGLPEREVRLADLKGVFFVKDLEGDLGHAKSNLFDPQDRAPGRKVRIQFKDGEVLAGFSLDYLPVRPGFFLLPADRNANADRCYVLVAATARITVVDAPAEMR
jgi:hypothetical protein